MDQHIGPEAAAVLAVGPPAIGFVLTGLTLRPVAGPRLSKWLLAAGPLSLMLLVAYVASFDPIAAAANVGVAGLTQRILVTLTLATHALIGYTTATQRGTTAPASASTLTAVRGQV